MVYANQQAYYDAITASTNAGQSGPFIDFMLNEIYNTLKVHQGEQLPHGEGKAINTEFGDEFGDEFGIKFGIKFGVNEKQLLILLDADPTLSASEIADRIGISKRGVEKQLKKFKDLGILTRSGNNRNGTWIINKRKV